MSRGTIAADAPSRRLPDLASFGGTVLDAADLDPVALTGLRVALVGRPAAVVRALPRTARHAAHVDVFQADAAWVLPKHPLAPVVDAVAPLVPADVRHRVLRSVAGSHLRRGIRDGWTRRHLTPIVAPEGGTVVRSNRYHRALRAPHVRLVMWPIAGAVPAGLRTADGLEHHVDAVVVAT